MYWRLRNLQRSRYIRNVMTHVVLVAKKEIQIIIIVIIARVIISSLKTLTIAIKRRIQKLSIIIF